MNVVLQASESLETALKSVEGARMYRSGTSNIDPPATIVAPPMLSWDSFCAGPTSATFLVYVAVSWSERALARLWGFLESVEAALVDVPDAVLTTASPTTFNAGGTDLPAYELQIEVGL